MPVLPYLLLIGNPSVTFTHKSYEKRTCTVYFIYAYFYYFACLGFVFCYPPSQVEYGKRNAASCTFLFYLRKNLPGQIVPGLLHVGECRRQKDPYVSTRIFSHGFYMVGYGLCALSIW